MTTRLMKKTKDKMLRKKETRDLIVGYCTVLWSVRVQYFIKISKPHLLKNTEIQYRLKWNLKWSVVGGTRKISGFFMNFFIALLLNGRRAYEYLI